MLEPHDVLSEPERKPGRLSEYGVGGGAVPDVPIAQQGLGVGAQSPWSWTTSAGTGAGVVVAGIVSLDPESELAPELGRCRIR